MTPHWTQNLFNQNYLRIQAKFSSRHTAKESDLIVQYLSLTNVQKVLDLACGHGRHSLELAQRGFSVLGLDASQDAITQASLVPSEASFVCEDFCSIKCKAQFNAVLNMFDSLLYDDDATHLEILKALHKALKPEGKLPLGSSNRDYKLRLWWLEQHWFFGVLHRGLRFIKRLLVMALGLTQREYNELTGVVHGFLSMYHGTYPLELHGFSLRLYTLSELMRLLEQAGFEVMKVNGISSQNATHFLVLASALSQIPNHECLCAKYRTDLSDEDYNA